LTIWPFPEDAVKKMLKSVQTVIVPELNQGQMRQEIERIAKDKSDSAIKAFNIADGRLISPAILLKLIKGAV